MMGGKKSFLLYKQDIFLLDSLSKTQLGELFAMMLQWQNGDESVRAGVKSDDALVNGFFSMFARRFEDEEREYQRICDVRRESGRKGGEANATKCYQKQAKESKTSKSNPILSQDNNINNNYISTKGGIEVVPPNTDNDTKGGIKEENAVQKSKWRYLSSATINHLKTTGQDVAEYKKMLLRQEVEALDILTPEGVEAFVNKWGEHNPNSDTIAAELEHIFDVAARARNYVKKFGKNQSAAAAPVDYARFEEGRSYWKRDFTSAEIVALPFEARKHVLRGGAVKRVNGNWKID